MRKEQFEESIANYSNQESRGIKKKVESLKAEMKVILNMPLNSEEDLDKFKYRIDELGKETSSVLERGRKYIDE